MNRELTILRVDDFPQDLELKIMLRYYGVHAMSHGAFQRRGEELWTVDSVGSE